MQAQNNESETTTVDQIQVINFKEETPQNSNKAEETSQECEKIPPSPNSINNPVVPHIPSNSHTPTEIPENSSNLPQNPSENPISQEQDVALSENSPDSLVEKLACPYQRGPMHLKEETNDSTGSEIIKPEEKNLDENGTGKLIIINNLLIFFFNLFIY